MCTILALDLFVTINLFYNPCIRLPIKPFMYLWHQDYENKVISYRVMATGISEVHMAAILEIYCLGPQSTFYLLATSESSWDITGTLKPFRDLVRSCWVALETISHAGLFISHSDIGNNTSLFFFSQRCTHWWPRISMHCNCSVLIPNMYGWKNSLMALVADFTDNGNVIMTVWKEQEQLL